MKQVSVYSTVVAGGNHMLLWVSEKTIRPTCAMHEGGSE